jgi:putative oxidoreductase
MATIAALILRIGVGALLVVAGLLKLKAPGAFATEIANYQLTPALAPYLAVALPVVEVVTGVALAVGPRAWRRAAALVALVLFGMFELAVAAAYLRGINIDCGCFGTGGGPITILTVLRNALLIAASAILLRVEGQPSRARGLPASPRT